MATKAETYITDGIIAWIEGQLGDAHKVHGNGIQRSGEPDIDGAIEWTKGVFVHLKLEVKTPTGKPSRLQVARIRRYKELGYCAGFVTSVYDTRELIMEFVGENRCS